MMAAGLVLRLCVMAVIVMAVSVIAVGSGMR